jgi:hypothetical protein
VISQLPDHALQRTAPRVTVAASAAAFPQPVRRAPPVPEVGLVKGLYAMTLIRIVGIILALQGPVLAGPPFNYDAARSWIEHENANSDVPASERIFVSGPERVSNNYILNGKPAVRVIDKNRVIRFSEGMTASMLLRKLGMTDTAVAVLVYRADRQMDPLRVTSEGLSKFQLKPQDVVRLVSHQQRPKDLF